MEGAFKSEPSYSGYHPSQIESMDNNDVEESVYFGSKGDCQRWSGC